MTEDNDVKDYTQPESEPPKMLPSPEEKKRHILHLDIDIEDLFTNIPQIETPKNEQTWSSAKEMSEDYKKLYQQVQVLTMYIARACNEGAEVKDNVSKRLTLARTVLGTLVNNLAISGYDAYGMLYELQQELFMRIDGRRSILKVLAEIEEAKEQAAQEKAQGYTS